MTETILNASLPIAASDQQPRFHFMPHSPDSLPGFSNDIQLPFYDPTHQMYHMGFAWHPNSSSFGPVPNHVYHIVSKGE